MLIINTKIRLFMNTESCVILISWKITQLQLQYSFAPKLLCVNENSLLPTNVNSFTCMVSKHMFIIVILS